MLRVNRMNMLVLRYVSLAPGFMDVTAANYVVEDYEQSLSSSEPNNKILHVSLKLPAQA